MHTMKHVFFVNGLAQSGVGKSRNISRKGRRKMQPERVVDCFGRVVCNGESLEIRSVCGFSPSLLPYMDLAIYCDWSRAAVDGRILESTRLCNRTKRLVFHRP